MSIPLHWHTEPFLLISILGVGWSYALCIGPLKFFFTKEKTYPKKAAVSFFCGLAIVYLTIASPLDQIGEDFLFSAHMIQHMLLIYIAPPFFFWGTPWWLMDAILKIPTLYSLARFLFNPAIAGICFVLGYSMWHIPILYEAAIQNKLIHILEHTVMFGTAIQMWWPILSPSKKIPRSNYGVCMLLVFLLMVAQYPVFGYITFSGEVLYSIYEYAPRIVNLTPLQDQILAGVIMNVFSMFESLTVLSLCFYNWYLEDKKYY
jgi:putative membrane protein